VCIQSVHLSFAEGMDIGEPDTAVRRAVLDRQKDAIGLAADLGASVAVQHPSLYRDQEQSSASISRRTASQNWRRKPAGTGSRWL